MDKLKTVLSAARDQQIITPQQFEQVLALAIAINAPISGQTVETVKTPRAPRFVLAHLLYYFGGMVAIGAMSWLMTMGFMNYGGGMMMGICLCYAVLGGAVARMLFQRGLDTPYAILLGFILCLVPLFVFALMNHLGIWQDDDYRDYHHWIDGRWLALELSTLFVGALMLYQFRRSFLMLPLAVTLWYLSMDLAPLFNSELPWWELRRTVSMFFGLILIAFTVWLDFRQHEENPALAQGKGQDFAFWFYIVGVMCFWGALSLHDSDKAWEKFGYCLINLAMMWLGVILRRRVFTIFGALGVSYYLGDLAYHVFKDSMIFPLILTLLGFAIIFLGIWWQRHGEQCYQFWLARLPSRLQHILWRLYQSD